MDAGTRGAEERMSGAPVQVGPVLAAVLLALAASGAVVAGAGGLGYGRRVLTAAGRATVQLFAVSLLLGAVLASGWATAGFVGVMVGVAALTAGRRIARGRRLAWAAVPILAGLAPVLALVLATGLVPWRPIAVVPVAGILIGGAMSATGLAGRRAVEEVSTRFGEYEAGLALGLLPRDAALEVSRPAAALALVPALDQTRTVGLVTLPGAFVGVLLGGGSPAEAGAAQLLVLVGLLAVEAVAVLCTVELIAVGAFGPLRRVV